MVFIDLIKVLVSDLDQTDAFEERKDSAESVAESEPVWLVLLSNVDH